MVDKIIAQKNFFNRNLKNTKLYAARLAITIWDKIATKHVIRVFLK